MLTNEQQCVLNLLQASLGIRETVPAVSGLDAHELASIIRRNGIILTVFPQLKNNSQVQAVLQNEYYASVHQWVQQICEGKRILEALSDAGMDCMALKGWEMQRFYPHKAMRQMADFDVLIRPYEYKRVFSVMESLGFEATYGGESFWKHDNFRRGVVTVEAHKRLTDDSSTIQSWERHVWDFASCDQHNIWRMSEEDYFIFHIVHMHKDILNGSLGLRRIVDLWLLERSINLKGSRVSDELENMGLSTFHSRMSHLSKVCMGDESIDEHAAILLDHAFSCGIYGNDTSYKVGRIARLSHGGFTTGKIRSLVSAVFLPYGRMKAQFPELEKWPILLPAFWMRRIARHLRYEDLSIYRQMLDYSDVSEEDVERMRRVLEAAGC